MFSLFSRDHENNREQHGKKSPSKWNNNYLLTHIRIFKGELETFREDYFSEGVRDSFWSYFFPSVARDEMGSKRVENPQGKVNPESFLFSRENPNMSEYLVLFHSEQIY